MLDHSFDKIAGEIANPDRLLAASIALVIVMAIGFITGPVAGNANPFIWNLLDRLFGGIARKSYNTQRSHGSLAFRGTFFAILFIFTGFAIGACVHLLDRRFPLNGFMEPLLLSLTLTAGSVWLSLSKLYHALATGKSNHKASFFPIAVSTRSDLNSTDDFGITRVGIGFMAQSFDRGLVAPLFWYLIGGVPLAFGYAGMAAARWALAKDGFSKGLGDTASWFEKLFGFIPHLISGFYMAFVSVFTPTARITRAVPGLFRSKGRAPYAQGGLPVTAVAWALNISLGGPVQDLDGSVLKKAWVGSSTATAKLDKGHIRRAIYMSVMVHILILASLIGGIVLHHLVEGLSQN